MSNHLHVISMFMGNTQTISRTHFWQHIRVLNMNMHIYISYLKLKWMIYLNAIIPDINECNGTDIIIHNCEDGTSNVYTNVSDYSEVQGKCHNTQGSFYCRCPDGYLWESINQYCVGE